MMTTLLAVLGSVLLVIGLILLTIALIGVLRQTKTLNQLHAQGLATGPGVIAVLAASIAMRNVAVITFAALAIAFVACTSPVSSHVIARLAQRRRQRHPS